MPASECGCLGRVGNAGSKSSEPSLFAKPRILGGAYLQSQPGHPQPHTHVLREALTDRPLAALENVSADDLAGAAFRHRGGRPDKQARPPNQRLVCPRAQRRSLTIERYPLGRTPDAQGKGRGRDARSRSPGGLPAHGRASLRACCMRIRTCPCTQAALQEQALFLGCPQAGSRDLWDRWGP